MGNCSSAHRHREHGGHYFDDTSCDFDGRHYSSQEEDLPEIKIHCSKNPPCTNQSPSRLVRMLKAIRCFASSIPSSETIPDAPAPGRFFFQSQVAHIPSSMRINCELEQSTAPSRPSAPSAPSASFCRSRLADTPNPQDSSLPFQPPAAGTDLKSSAASPSSESEEKQGSNGDTGSDSDRSTIAPMTHHRRYGSRLQGFDSGRQSIGRNVHMYGQKAIFSQSPCVRSKADMFESGHDYSYDPHHCTEGKQAPLPPKKRPSTLKTSQDYSYVPQQHTRHTLPSNRSVQHRRPLRIVNFQVSVESLSNSSREHGFEPRYIEPGSAAANEAEAFIMSRRQATDTKAQASRLSVCKQQLSTEQSNEGNGRRSRSFVASLELPSIHAPSLTPTEPLAVSMPDHAAKFRAALRTCTSHNAETVEALMAEFSPKEWALYLRIQQRLTARQHVTTVLKKSDRQRKHTGACAAPRWEAARY